MPFGHADGKEYDVVSKSVKAVADIEGMTCEVGLREGGGSLYMIKALKETNQNRMHIAIDPYGDIPYFMHENQCLTARYDNNMKYDTLAQMYKWCQDNKQDFTFFCLESSEFFKRYHDGVPLYSDHKKTLVNKYSCVYLDAQHRSTEVLPEVFFFSERMNKGAILVMDDCDFYDHYELVHPIVERLGFGTFIKGNHKHAYIKL